MGVCVLQREIQDADAQEHSFPGPRGWLVHHCWLEGCLLPHTGGLEAHKVPQVCLWRKALPIQGSSIWASSGPKDVHQVYGCSSSPAEAPGHPDPQLPGWLARFSQFLGAGDSSQGLTPSPSSHAWQSPRPHGSGFPGYSLGAAPYETIPLVDDVPG